MAIGHAWPWGMSIHKNKISIGSNSTLKKLIAVVMTCTRKNMTIAKKETFLILILLLSHIFLDNLSCKTSKTNGSIFQVNALNRSWLHQ